MGTRNTTRLHLLSIELASRGIDNFPERDEVLNVAQKLPSTTRAKKKSVSQILEADLRLVTRIEIEQMYPAMDPVTL